jgi:hypothetical protein
MPKAIPKSRRNSEEQFLKRVKQIIRLLQEDADPPATEIHGRGQQTRQFSRL